jgi:hypothetical protein
MAHFPVNHHLRPLYRLLSGLSGLYVLIFGLVGFFQTSGSPAFQRGSTAVLGLHTNLALAVASIVVGVIILLCVVVGRNLDVYVDLAAGSVFLLTGMAMLALLRTDGNFLNFSIATCVVSFILGMVLFTAGLYVRVGSEAAAKAEEAYRHGGH